MWHDWLRKRFADNMPYDEIVRGILCATSRDGQSPEEWLKEVKAIEQTAQTGFTKTYAERPSLDLFWRVGRMPTLEEMGERTAAAFLGVRLECAQCHKHPFDRWTQADYRAHANVFGQVGIGISPEAREAVEAENKARGLTPAAIGKGAGITEVYLTGAKTRALPHPDSAPAPATKMKGAPPAPPPLALRPRALGGPEIALELGKDARVALFEWLRSPDNPWFARSLVNRLWGHYFGVGLVDPVDNFSLANPPSNEKLLDALARDFVDHKFDIRRLERIILTSRVYQLASEMNETNKLDRINYSHSLVRPLMAEVVVDVLNSATGVVEDFGADASPGSHAIEVGASRIQNPSVNYVFRTFGRPAPHLGLRLRARLGAWPTPDALRNDGPGRGREAARAGDAEHQGQADPDPARRPARQAAQERQDRRRYPRRTVPGHAEPVPLGRGEKKALRRLSDDPEGRRSNRAGRGAREGQGSGEEAVLTPREAAFVDAFWALINTREFLLNH